MSTFWDTSLRKEERKALSRFPPANRRSCLTRSSFSRPPSWVPEGFFFRRDKCGQKSWCRATVPSSARNSLLYRLRPQQSARKPVGSLFRTSTFRIASLLFWCRVEQLVREFNLPNHTPNWIPCNLRPLSTSSYHGKPKKSGTKIHAPNQHP